MRGIGSMIRRGLLGVGFRHKRDLDEPIHVVLWGKPDCCLCDRAYAILDRLAAEYPLRLEKRDITKDPLAYERYRLVIPVVEVNGEKCLEGKVTELWLRRAFDQIR